MHGDGEAHDGGAQVEALHHPAGRGGQQNGADETAGKDKNVVNMCQRHVVSPPEVGGDNHHTGAEAGGEGDAREAAGKEAHAESCGEGGCLQVEFHLFENIMIQKTRRRTWLVSSLTGVFG